MSHKQQIRRHLEMFGRITTMTAIQQYGCTRLAARIYDLRRDGMDIRTTEPENGGNHAVYKHDTTDTTPTDA